MPLRGHIVLLDEQGDPIQLSALGRSGRATHSEHSDACADREHTEDHPSSTKDYQALKSGWNLNYPATAPFGSSSDLKTSSTLSKFASRPSVFVQWSRPALSRNASFQVSLVTPSVSCRSTDSTASTSGHPSNSAQLRADQRRGGPGTERRRNDGFRHLAQAPILGDPDAGVLVCLRHADRTDRSGGSGTIGAHVLCGIQHDVDASQQERAV